MAALGNASLCLRRIKLNTLVYQSSNPKEQDCSTRSTLDLLLGCISFKLESYQLQSTERNFFLYRSSLPHFFLHPHSNCKQMSIILCGHKAGFCRMLRAVNWEYIREELALILRLEALLSLSGHVSEMILYHEENRE